MTFKARDLGATTAIGRSIRNEGRVVIYKPKPTKGKQMAFGRASSLGKPLTDYALTIPQAEITADIQQALIQHFKSYGGYDSYGRTTVPYRAYAYPADHAPSGNVPVTIPDRSELVGAYGDFYRMKQPPTWIKKAQTEELLQSTVDAQVKKIVSTSVGAWLVNNKGDGLEKLLNQGRAGLNGVVNALTANVKALINSDPWFQSWGLKVG
jgi:hypothetical protein